jgi:hypothetical protein
MYQQLQFFMQLAYGASASCLNRGETDGIISEEWKN